MVALGLAPPTIRLPPIAKLASSPAESLIDALHYLRLLYSPEVRGSRRVKKVLPNLNSTPASNANFEPDSTIRDALDLLRADAYERTYAMRWLTALISDASTFENIDFQSNFTDRDPAEEILAAQYEAILTAASS